MTCLSSGGSVWRMWAGFQLASAMFLPAQNGNPPSTVRGEWPTYGGDLASTKYSPLDQITKDNFSKLKIAWRAKTPDATLSITVAGGGEWTASPSTIFAELKRIDPKRWRDGTAPFTSNFKATPLMVGGVLYLNSPSSVGAALDAATGATRWVYNPKSYEAGTTTMSARWNQRGVAYWTDGKEERIYWGTGDGYLIAVDAKTGRPCEDFGKNGRVDLMEGLPRAKRGERDFLNALTYSVQSPPLVVRDVVITPASISSYIINKEQIPGWLRGFDVRTGELKWTFRTVPRPGDYGLETWKDDSWAYAGKATVWSMMSADAELGYVYIPTNTTAPDFYGGHRPGNNLFAESILCLNVETGKRVWHFQTVHHGFWDYDNPAAPNLMNITVEGKAVKALAQITKQGFVYAFDRVTGNPIWPIEERPVPASDIPGEATSPTQPFPTKPPPFARQKFTVDDLSPYLSPADRAKFRDQILSARNEGLFTPPAKRGTIQMPGNNGGANWGGAAVDPDKGTLVVVSKDLPSLLQLESDNTGEDRYLSGFGFMIASDGLSAIKPPWTSLTAYDLNQGIIKWKIALGDVPGIKGTGTHYPKVGPVITAGGLLFTGTRDKKVRAFDVETGKLLWETEAPAALEGMPAVYEINGREYIVFCAAAQAGLTPATQSPIPGSYIAFTLPTR